MAPHADTATADALDDVFDNYMVDSDEDPFRDLDTTIPEPKTTANKKRKSGSDDEGDGLGVDEKVKVAKKRRPLPKLDEARLLSQLGLPKLKASFKSKLAPKLKGKGHEFSDTARLLQFYQLWLDVLYPRAKFADGLSMIEKIGHSKRMQVMRKTWIDENKRKSGMYMEDGDYQPVATLPDRSNTTEAPKETDTTSNAAANSIFGNGQIDDDSLFIPDTNPRDSSHEDAPPDDELDDLLAEQLIPADTKKSSRQEDSEGEDDIDALFAMERTNNSNTKPKTTRQAVPDDDDDLDALLAEHDSRLATNAVAKFDQKNQQDEEDDDLDALLAEREAYEEAVSSNSLLQSKSTAANEDEDDLDALLAEQEVQSKPNASTVPTSSSGDAIANTNTFDEPDDLDAILAEAEGEGDETTSLPPQPTILELKNKNTPNLEPKENEDDLQNALPSSSPVKDPEHADLDEADLDGIM